MKTPLVFVPEVARTWTFVWPSGHSQGKRTRLSLTERHPVDKLKCGGKKALDDVHR